MASGPKLFTADGCEHKVRTGNPLLPVVTVLTFALVIVLGVALHLNGRLHKLSKTSTVEATAWTIAPSSSGNLTIGGNSIYVEEVKKRDEIWKHRPHLSPPADPPPSEIAVGPFTYHVHYTSAKALKSQGSLALTDLAAREIWLNPKRSASLRDDLLHELMHCAKDIGTGGGHFIGRYEAEENLIEGVSAPLLEIMKHNPELLQWMTR